MQGKASNTLREGSVLVHLKHNSRAKRLILRLHPSSGHPTVTVPPGVSETAIRKFIASNEHWISEKLAQYPAGKLLQEGASIPVRGLEHKIVHVGNRRGTVRILENGDQLSLLVSGNEVHIERRVIDWLKRQARQDLERAVERHSRFLDVKPAAIRIKDTTSRWGSCSSKRVLSFSWRVIMAPSFVLDYLAAHEVAHLREMNHSQQFWAHVAETCPDFEDGKAWLRQNGATLHAYGARK